MRLGRSNCHCEFLGEAAETAAETAADAATDTATELHKRAAVKRSRRAQTVLGDRRDLVYEILLQVQSAACGTRPAEFFNGWKRKLKCDGNSRGYSRGLHI